MKKLLLVSLLLIPIVASAAIVPCPPNTAIPWATWSAWGGAGNGCEVGDKIFENFVPVGFASEPSLLIALSGPNDETYTANLESTTFIYNFTLDYDISIDPTQLPALLNPSGWRIISVSAGMQDSGASDAVFTKTLSGGASGSETLTDVGGFISPTGMIMGLSATSLHVSDAFTFVPGGSGIINISNTFNQGDTSIPEPGSMALLGIGVMGLVALRRKRA